MSRMGYFVRHPRRTLAGLATLMVASGMVVGTGAYFQSTDTSNGSSVSAGTIALNAFGGADDASSNGRDWDARQCVPREADKPQQHTAGGDYFGCYNSLNNGTNASIRGGAIFEISNIEPGQVVNKQMRLRNVGSLDARTYLRLVDKTDNALFNALDVYVKNVSNGHSLVYAGALNGLDDQWRTSDNGDPLGENEDDIYEFSIKLPETGADQSALMGTSTTLKFEWLGRDQGAPTP